MNERQDLEAARRVFRDAPFVADIGAELVDLGEGYCRSRVALAPRHLQHGGVVHAGVQATLADHTAGAAASTAVGHGYLVLTADFRISLLRPARGEALTCEARVIKAGGRLVFAEADVYCEADGEARRVARASATLAVLPAAQAAGTEDPAGDAAGDDRVPAAAAYGVDGCKGGWLFFGLADGDHEFGIAEHLDDLLPEFAGARRVLVDIPIGLASAGSRARRCDGLARGLLGPRASSVFPAPTREALACGEYAAACDANARVTGRRISRQAWGLAEKIREADRLLAGSEVARRVLRESHPELCFYGLAGGRPMNHPKRTGAGRAERMAVLHGYWAGADEALAHALAHLPRGLLAADDVVDALALALAAALPDQRLATLPSPPEQDAEGRWMEMAYPVVPG